MNETTIMKQIQIEVTEEEVTGLTSALVDLLDYYNTLRNSEKEFKILNTSIKLSQKITDAYFSSDEVVPRDK